MKVTRWISSTALLAALFVLAAPTTSAAQQAPDPARVAVPASSAGASSPSTLPGPRLSAEFQRAEPPPMLARSATSGASSLAAAGGQTTIVVSTLVLVLAVIIIVLLIK